MIAPENTPANPYNVLLSLFRSLNASTYKLMTITLVKSPSNIGVPSPKIIF